MLNQYWQLVRLQSSGKAQIAELAIAQAYIQEFCDSPDVSDRALQLELFQQFQSGVAEAGLCLRCVMSHYVLQECRAIVRQFGQHYQFTESDLFPYVLQDEGRLDFDKPYRPLTWQILQKFDPKTAQLSTWTARLVRQHGELTQFLKAQGLWLISDWAILNDTSVSRMQRVLRDVYQQTESEVAQAGMVLESYRSIYLPDHLAQGSGKCSEPTLNQRQRMAAWMQAKFACDIPPATILSQLQQVAYCLRQYRLGKAPLPQPLSPATEEPEIQSFLARYREQFERCLAAAIDHVIRDRLTKFKSEARAQNFLTALRLSYCDRLTQTEIAKQMELRQDQIANLLKLSDLRVAIRLHMLTHLKKEVIETAEKFTDVARLRQFDQQIAAVLEEEVTALIQHDRQEAYTAQSYMKGSRLGQQICAYLSDCDLFKHDCSYDS